MGRTGAQAGPRFSICLLSSSTSGLLTHQTPVGRWLFGVGNGTEVDLACWLRKGAPLPPQPEQPCQHLLEGSKGKSYGYLTTKSPVCKEKVSTKTLHEWKEKRIENHAPQGKGLFRGASAHPPEQSQGPTLKGGVCRASRQARESPGLHSSPHPTFSSIYSLHHYMPTQGLSFPS